MNYYGIQLSYLSAFISFLIKLMLSIFQRAMKFDCQVLAIFQSFYELVMLFLTN